MVDRLALFVQHSRLVAVILKLDLINNLLCPVHKQYMVSQGETGSAELLRNHFLIPKILIYFKKKILVFSSIHTGLTNSVMEGM